jgi:leucyl-tRNA synthetase
MLSDSPPDRDVIWSEEGVAGANRFVQRVWRLVGDWSTSTRPAADDARPNAPSAEALALRKAVHRALAAVDMNIAALRFNVAIARIHELVNAIATAVSGDLRDAALVAAIDEAMGLLAAMMAPRMPHLAEECWAALGHDEMVSTRPWPAVVQDLLVEESVTMPVQVNGKKRGELTIAADASQADFEAATLGLDVVRRALDGQSPKKIVVVPKRIVNVVV